MDIAQTRNLRVSLDGDSSGYVSAMNAKVAADRAATSSSKDVVAAVTASTQKINQSGDVVAQLSRKYVDGARQSQQFTSEVAKLGRALETGRAQVSDVADILEGMSKKLGIVADAAQVAASGNIALSKAVSEANARLVAQQATVDELTLSYQRMAAEAKAAYAADQAQAAINRQLGVQTSSSGSASASASVLSAALDRRDELDRLRSVQAGQNFTSDLNDRLNVNGFGTSAKASADAFEDAAKQADLLAQKVATLRAQIDPIGASQERLNAELAEYNRLAASSEITTTELAQAQALATARHDQLVSSMNKSSGGQVNHFAATNVAYQAQDAITQAIGGSSPLTIGFQQGPQLAMGLAGNDGTGTIKTLLSGFGQLISLTNVASIGLIAVGAAGIQAFEKIRVQVKPLADALKDEEDALKRIAAAYGGVAEQAAKAAQESRPLVDAIGAKSTTALTASTNAAGYDFFSEFGTVRKFVKGGGDYAVDSQYAPFSDALKDLRTGAQSGKADFDAFYEAIDQKVTLDPTLATAGDKIIAESEKFKQATDALKEYQRVRTAVFNDQGPNGMLLSQGTSNQQDAGNYALFESQQKVALQRSQQAFDAQVAGINAKTAEQKAAAARQAAAAEYNNDETPTQRSQRINQAGQLAQIQAAKELADAERDRQLSLDKNLSDQQLEIDLIGKTTGQQTALRQQYELTSQLRIDAAKNGTTVDQKELDLIKQKSDALGKLAEDYARAKLNDDLGFERDQIFRSDTDQQVASRLRSSGLTVDLSSQEAQAIRDNLNIQQLRDGVKGFFTDFNDGLLQGDSFGKAAGNAIIQGLSSVESKIADKVFDQMTNSILSAFGIGSSKSPTASVGATVTNLLSGSSLQAANNNTSLSAAALAIKSIESGGNYSALGPVTANGDRAIGAYQVMSSNVGPWTQQTLGYSMTPSAFLASPSSQDAVFSKIFGGYSQQYGMSGAAQAWFGGPGSVGKGGNVADMLGTTGTQYVKKFNSALDDVTGSTTQASQSVGKLSSDATTATQNVSGLGTSTKTAADGLNTLGSGLSKFGQALQSANLSGNGGLASLLGSLTSYGQSVFNSSSQFASAISAGGLGLYDGGGFTGHGGVNEPAGVVHRGEVVWSQQDVARAGGVSTVEAMRLGLRGYASGGAAAASTAPANSNQPSSSGVQVNVFNNGSSTVNVRRRDTSQGVALDVMIDEVTSSNINTPGSKSGRAIQAQYGLKRGLASR